MTSVKVNLFLFFEIFLLDFYDISEIPKQQQNMPMTSLKIFALFRLSIKRLFS